MIHVGRSRVEHHVIVQVLDVAGPEGNLEAEAWVGAQLVEQIQCLAQLCGQRRSILERLTDST